jgi:hypothetical protein
MSQGNNIIGVVGTSIGWVASDILDVDAKLSPVGNYGGFGMTVAPMNDSPAIDGGQNCVRDLSCAANNPVNAVSSDQRLANRDDATVDIGAYETNSAYVAELPDGELAEAYNFVITPNASTFTYGVTSGTLPPGLNFVTSLFRLAKSGVPAGVVSLSGTPTSAGTFPFSLTINGAGNSAVVNYSLTINGTSANVSIGGKVVNNFGAGISGAIVTISDGGSFIQSRRANTFGYFNFDGIPSGQNYSITVQRKGYTFDPFPITPTGNVGDIVITATSNN